MKTNVSVTIDRPVEEVFDVLADARNEPQWNSQVSTSVLETGEPIGPGSRFTTVNRGQPYDAVITGYDRPHRLVYEVTGKPMAITGTMILTDLGGRTKVDGEFDMRPNGFMKAMLPLMAPAVRRDFPKQFAGLKRLVESRPASG